MSRTGDTNMNKNRRWNLKTPNWTLFRDIIEDEIIKIQHNDQSNIENSVKILSGITIICLKILYYSNTLKNNYNIHEIIYLFCLELKSYSLDNTVVLCQLYHPQPNKLYLFINSLHYRIS